MTSPSRKDTARDASVILRQHAKSPTKARIRVPDALYDIDDLVAIANAANRAFSDCLLASVGAGALAPGKRSKNPTKMGIENGPNGTC